MIDLQRFVLICFVCFSIGLIGAQATGSTGLPSRYHVSGVIQLPYAEISEPFESWIDINLGYSRIDYYGGAAKTLQRKGKANGDYGANYKIVPISSNSIAIERIGHSLIVRHR